MIRQLQCLKCARRSKPLEQEDLHAGWHMRLVKGKAQKPQKHQIVIRTDNKPPEIIPLAILLCDLCSDEIADGAEAVAFTFWRGDEPEAWEHEFLRDGMIVGLQFVSQSL